MDKIKYSSIYMGFYKKTSLCTGPQRLFATFSIDKKCYKKCQHPTKVSGWAETFGFGYLP